LHGAPCARSTAERRTGAVRAGTPTPVKELEMSKVIGIDLGTTNSCIAFIQDGEPRW
jgi:hypothetical protein